MSQSSEPSRRLGSEVSRVSVNPRGHIAKSSPCVGVRYFLYPLIFLPFCLCFALSWFNSTKIPQSTPEYPQGIILTNWSPYFILPAERQFSAESLLRCVGVDWIPRRIRNMTILTNIQSIPSFAKNNNRWHFRLFVFYFSLENYGTKSLNFKCI